MIYLDKCFFDCNFGIHFSSILDYLKINKAISKVQETIQSSYHQNQIGKGSATIYKTKSCVFPILNYLRFTVVNFISILILNRHYDHCCWNLFFFWDVGLSSSGTFIMLFYICPVIYNFFKWAYSSLLSVSPASVLLLTDLPMTGFMFYYIFIIFSWFFRSSSYSY